MGTTYEGEDTRTGEPVALKTLSLARVEEWKAIELFEREARVLSNIDHPNIPDYIDYIAEGDEFWLVQELVAGRSLARAVEEGWRPTEAEFRELAAKLLEILIYLHELRPPVIHRDIKPLNVLERDDGRIFLVDFGAVRDTERSDNTFSSTVVGTHGYMAPEQYHAQATEVSDLYGLGTTLVHVVTGRQPEQLPRKRLKIDVEEATSLSPPLAAWLGTMVEPAPEDRFPSARDALEALRNAGKTPTPGEPSEISSVGPTDLLSRKPRGSKIHVERHADQTKIELPASWARNALKGLPTLGFSLFWLGFVAIWTLLSLRASVLFAAFSIPFWLVGFGMLFTAIRALAGSDTIHLRGRRAEVTKKILGVPYRSRGPEIIDSVTTGELTKKYPKSKPGVSVSKHVVLRAGVDEFKVGSNLTDVELRWLEELLSSLLESEHERVVLDHDSGTDEAVDESRQKAEQRAEHGW